jgi:hypothetical protein
MRILVYLRDGRTVYLIDGRAKLARLASREPWSEGANDGIAAVRGIWNHETRDWDWQRVVLRYVAKSTISHVEEARGISDAAKGELAAA